MLRALTRSTLALTTFFAGLAIASAALAGDCPNCRGGAGGVGLRGNTMGSVAYGGGAGGYVDPYAGASGVCRDRAYPQPDLFYNFYQHGPCGGYPAAMYVSPKPVPPNVGHTYITYQPLMPHEFMYKHHRTYHQYYDGGRGLTRAKVIYW
jgi:hypothetical protein